MLNWNWKVSCKLGFGCSLVVKSSLPNYFVAFLLKFGGLERVGLTK